MEFSLSFSVGSSNIFIISIIKNLSVFLQWGENSFKYILSVIIVVSFAEQSKLMTIDEILPMCNCKGSLTDKK